MPILFFKPSFCNGPETKLKWKTDIENLHNICILSYTDSWCLVCFSSNISCDRKHNVRLCCDHRGIGGSVVDNVPPVTGLIGWRSVVELRRLRLVLMSGSVPAEQNCGDGRWTGKPREQRSRAYARCRDDSC